MNATAIADMIGAIFIGIQYARCFPNRNLSKSSRLMCVCLVVMFISLVADAGAYVIVGPEYPLALRYFLNLLSFTMPCANMIVLTYYEEALFGEKAKINPWFFRVIKLVEYFWMLCSVYEYIAGHLVSYDANGLENINFVYSNLVVALNLVIVIYMPVITLINRRKIGNDMALLLVFIGLVPIFTSLLYSVAGVDLAYVLSAIALVLIGEFVQKKHAQSMKTEQEKQLQKALDTARIEAQHNAMLYEITDTSPWSYEISADDEVISADYSDRLVEHIDANKSGNAMGWTRLLHPDDKERVINGFMAAVRDHSGKTPYKESFRTLGLDGKYRWVKSAGYVLRRSDGSGEFFGSATDFTAQIEEEQQRRREMELQGIELAKSKLRADSLAYIVDFDPDMDDAIDFFGRRILEISRCDQVIFRDMNGHRIVLNAPGVEDIPQEICSECPFIGFNTDIFGEDGIVLMNDCREGFKGVKAHPSCPAKSSLMQLVYHEGKVVGLLIVHFLKEQHEFPDDAIDIMKTVASYLGLLIGRINARKAEQQRAKAEAENKAKTDFLFTMSHDIRTPMNAIIGFTNIAKKEIDNKEKVLESLEKVRLSSDILLNLINDVLDMSRIESGKMGLHEGKHELLKVYGSFEPAMSGLAASKDVNLKFSIGEIRDNYVFADGPRFDRVLINIISNAIKYTPAGGFVNVLAEQIEDTVPGYGNYRFTVSDSGIGMSEDFQQHMFEDFAREENAMTSKVQGTGLGLSLAKKLVDLMGGTISCISRQGIGTTFTVVFPFRLQTEADIAEEHALVQDNKEFSLRDKKVLLVEDNEFNREIAGEILADEGVLVETAVDGQKAVNKVRERGADYYDFILMDIQMPVMDGYEATRAIHALMPDFKTPIIALSANAFEEDKQKSLAEGMSAHIAKPIDVKVLLETIHGLVR